MNRVQQIGSVRRIFQIDQCDKIIVVDKCLWFERCRLQFIAETIQGNGIGILFGSRTQNDISVSRFPVGILQDFADVVASGLFIVKKIDQIL